MTEIEWDPRAEVRCVHVRECGACPLMPMRYEDQRAAKLDRVERALEGYACRSAESSQPVQAADTITGYRRRAKLVVARNRDGEVAVGLHRRHDNQSVVDIPGCQVLSPTLMALVSELRTLARQPPPELAALLEPVDGTGKGVLAGIDARELRPPKGGAAGADDSAGVLLTLIVAGERAVPVDELREAARELRRRLPSLSGVAVSLRYSTRQPSSGADFIALSGVSELKEAIDEGSGAGSYQYVSHTSFLQVHRGQASRLYRLIARLVSETMAGSPGRVLDLYGGTGAIALALAGAGHVATLVESYPPAAALATRAAQAQRLPVEVVTGDGASVAKALAGAGSKFDVVVANPPRRGLSPAAREAICALAPKRLIYVACELCNLSRDLDHLSRLGYRASAIYPIDVLPLTEEIEVVAVLEPHALPAPQVLHQEAGIVALNKPPHEPLQDQPEYPVSLAARARRQVDCGEWSTVLKIDPGTSGVCIFAKDEATRAHWANAIERSGRLIYLAAARGVTPTKGAITRELSGEDGAGRARTRYRRLAIGGGHSVLRVVPERRYTHQIRRHLSAIGHPVLGDMRYGHTATNRYFEEKHGLDRSFLHLVRVELDHPDTGERLLIESPLAPDLRACLVRASDESVVRFLENKGALGDAGSQLRPKEMEPLSGRSPLSVVEPTPESMASSYRQGAVSIRGGQPLELDDAPRTIRGELVNSYDEDVET